MKDEVKSFLEFKLNNAVKKYMHLKSTTHGWVSEAKCEKANSVTLFSKVRNLRVHCPQSQQLGLHTLLALGNPPFSYFQDIAIAYILGMETQPSTLVWLIVPLSL